MPNVLALRARHSTLSNGLKLACLPSCRTCRSCRTTCIADHGSFKHWKKLGAFFFFFFLRPPFFQSLCISLLLLGDHNSVYSHCTKPLSIIRDEMISAVACVATPTGFEQVGHPRNLSRCLRIVFLLDEKGTVQSSQTNWSCNERVLATNFIVWR